MHAVISLAHAVAAMLGWLCGPGRPAGILLLLVMLAGWFYTSTRPGRWLAGHDPGERKRNPATGKWERTGEPRTNATWSSRGEVHPEIGPRHHNWWHRPRRQRAAILHAAVAGPLIVLAGLAFTPLLAIIVLAVGLLAAATIASVRSWHRVTGARDKWNLRHLHYLAHRGAGQPHRVTPASYLSCPDPDTLIVDLAPSAPILAAKPAERDQYAQTCATLRGLHEAEATWRPPSRAAGPQLLLRGHDPLPVKLGLPDVAADVASMGPLELYLALGWDGPEVLDLTSMDAHTILSWLTQFGKTSTIRLLAMQCAARGFLVVICDYKGTHPWALDLPGVLYPRTIADVMAVYEWAGAQTEERTAWRNAHTRRDGTTDEPPPRRLVIFGEEVPATYGAMVTEHAIASGKRSAAGRIPAVDGLAKILHAGAREQMNVIIAANDFLAKFTGPDGGYANFGLRVGCNPNPQAIPRVFRGVEIPMTEHKGRVRMVRSEPKARPGQVPLASHEQATAHAQAGRMADWRQIPGVPALSTDDPAVQARLAYDEAAAEGAADPMAAARDAEQAAAARLELTAEARPAWRDLRSLARECPGAGSARRLRAAADKARDFPAPRPERGPRGERQYDAAEVADWCAAHPPRERRAA